MNGFKQLNGGSVQDLTKTVFRRRAAAGGKEMIVDAATNVSGVIIHFAQVASYSGYAGVFFGDLAASHATCTENTDAAVIIPTAAHFAQTTNTYFIPGGVDLYAHNSASANVQVIYEVIS